MQIIDFFIGAARNSNDPNFLSIILEANHILGLLRPFLEFELRNTALPIVQHGGPGERLMLNHKWEIKILILISECGLWELLPSTSTGDILDSVVF